MTKEKVLATLLDMPDEFETEQLIQKLLFIEKVEQGLEDIEKGRFSKFEEVKAEYEKRRGKLK